MNPYLEVFLWMLAIALIFAGLGIWISRGPN